MLSIRASYFASGNKSGDPGSLFEKGFWKLNLMRGCLGLGIHFLFSLSEFRVVVVVVVVAATCITFHLVSPF